MVEKKVETLKLTIRGMHCDHCVDSIERALTALDGVESCQVSVGLVHVVFSATRVARADLFECVRQAGAFEVTGFEKIDD